jgi:hypothetical protein
MFLYNQSETNINDLIDFLFKPNDVLACSIIKCINSDNTTITSHSRILFIILLHLQEPQLHILLYQQLNRCILCNGEINKITQLHHIPLLLIIK